MKRYGLDSQQSWLVVLAGSVIKIMAYGPTEVAGMLMVYTMYRYNATREAASLPYTLLYTIRNGSGPIIAYIGNVIGLRTTTLIGCVASSIAMGSCFFAESVITVTILWGVVFGFGFAFQGLLLNSITMEHFEINISKALAVTNAGAVLGVCLTSFYLDFLVNSYGLSGAFLLLAGATLHTIPAALFMILNKPMKERKSQVKETIVDTKLTDYSNKQKKNKETVKTSNNVATAENNFGYSDQFDSCVDRAYSANFVAICNDKNQQVNTTAYKVYSIDAFELKSNKSEQWIDTPLHFKNNEHDGQMNSFCKKDTNICSKSSSSETEPSNSTQNDNVQEKFQTNNLMRILFSQKIFWFILICNGMHYFTFPAFFTLLVDYAIDIGFDPVYAKYIVIYSQIVEFVGCLVLGWLADLHLISSNGFAITLFLCQCGSLLLMPLAQNIIFLSLVVLVFQWTQTGITLIYPSVVSDSFDKEFQPSALASMFILAAPLDLAISPLIGYFRDEKGSYTGVYLTLALAAFIGSLSQMCVLKCVNRRKQKTDT